MRVLALDTTTRAGSVAILQDRSVLYEALGDVSRAPAERLPGDLLRALDEVGWHTSDIDLYAVACGPGSFTGLRIGIATIQGLAFVNRKRVAGVSALLALAHGAADVAGEGAFVGAWMDAHRHEVFSALYRVNRDEPWTSARLTEIEAAAVGDPNATWRRWNAAANAPAVVVGDGAVLHADAISAARIVDAPLLAPIVARLAVDSASRGETVDPAGVQPLYVRRPDAEIARDAQRERAHQRGPA